MFNKIINHSLTPHKTENSNKELFNLNTAITVLYLLTNGFVIFIKFRLSNINNDHSLETIKDFSDI